MANNCNLRRRCRTLQLSGAVAVARVEPVGAVRGEGLEDVFQRGVLDGKVGGSSENEGGNGENAGKMVEIDGNMMEIHGNMMENGGTMMENGGTMMEMDGEFMMGQLGWMNRLDEEPL
jgi:hypothetical protein